MNQRGKSRGVTPRVVGPGSREPSAFEAGLADLVNVLNNRLAAMVGFAQLLARRSHAPEDRETVDRVVAEAMSAAQLVRDIVRLIRKPAGSRESTSLRTALEKALRRAHRELASQQVEVALDVDATVPLVAGRREDIVDLFMRLLRFAAVRLRRTPPPRHVTLTARAYGAGVVVSQVDSGPPLPAGRTAVDLDYFGPIDASFPGHSELALARRAAEQCGAGLQFGTNEAGQAEVAVTFIPGRLLAAPPLRRLRAGAAPVTQMHILVADDDRGNREALAQILGREGHRVTLAANGEEALDHLARTPFDAVVVDVHMPRLGGQAVYERTLSRSPELARRFVFVSGDDARASSRDFLEHVAQPRLFKPYTLADLLVAIGEVAARQGETPREP
jgi:CheY-like chemotaxis protein